MDTGNICSGCKRPLPPDAPQGLCPGCLIKAGLGTGVDIGPDSQSENTHARFVAPSVEELAKAFPQLEILGFIGQGGMGAVYKALQKSLDRVVALKILPPGIGDDPAFAERFAREAKALARLNHPGIVTLYEFGQTDGQFYFLMEFVDGVNLRHLLEAGRLSSREALAIVPQLCDALQYAHDQGIVHRDIKPENILLDRQGRVKVADFGLAKLVGTAEETSGDRDVTLGSVVLTEAGKVMGTPRYMAPEQSEAPLTVDHRADIYSLGVVLYQMLTGELPGKPLQPPSQKVQIDVRLDEVVLRALEKEPQLRYQQVSLVKTAVENITQSSQQEEASQHPADWKTWSPFQSQKVREICAHMTEAEKRAFTLQNYWVTIWNTATFFVMFFVIQFMSKPSGWIIALIFFLAGIASFPFWIRRHWQFLCKTAWAQQHAIKPDQLTASAGASAGILIVGRRNGKAVIRWSGVLMLFVLVLAVVESVSILTSLALMHSIDERAMFFAFMFTWMFTGMCIGLGLRTPVEKLTSLDGVSETNTATRGERDEQATAMNQESSGTKRMSRTAVWGAIWAFISLSFLFLIGLRVIGPERVSFSPWISLLLLPLILLGLTGPFGATILGWHSVSQIRRSEGRLYGMGLSVFDGLLFPLLVLDGVIGQMWCIVISCVLGILSGHFSTVPYDNRHNALDTLLVDHRVWFVFALALPICGVLNYFIIRSVWRAVNKPLITPQPTTDAVSTPDTGASSRSKRTWKISIIIGLVFLFIAASLGSLELYSRFSVKSHGQISASAPFVAKLPQGSVELVAISKHPSTPDQPWWRPDGSPYTGELLELRGIHCTADANQLAREFVIRREGFPEDVSFPVVKLEPSASMGGGGVYSNWRQDPDLYGIVATMPKTTRTMMLKVGISVGPWGKVIESKADGSSMFGVNYQGQDWSVSFSTASEIGGNACITVTHTAKDWDVRIVAVDKDGKEHTCSEIDSTCADAFWNTTVTFDGLPLANVKEFQFQVRPYHWVEFKNVSLQAGERTQVEVVDATGDSNTPQS